MSSTQQNGRKERHHNRSSDPHNGAKENQIHSRRFERVWEKRVDDLWPNQSHNSSSMCVAKNVLPQNDLSWASMDKSVSTIFSPYLRHWLMAQIHFDEFIRGFYCLIIVLVMPFYTDNSNKLHLTCKQVSTWIGAHYMSASIEHCVRHYNRMRSIQVKELIFNESIVKRTQTVVFLLYSFFPFFRLKNVFPFFLCEFDSSVFASNFVSASQ